MKRDVSLHGRAQARGMISKQDGDHKRERWEIKKNSEKAEWCCHFLLQKAEMGKSSNRFVISKRSNSRRLRVRKWTCGVVE